MANEIIKGMGFHHMALYVSDFDKSLAFYQKLGMKVFLLTDDLINKHEKDISGYKKGGFPELLEYINEIFG